MVGVDVQFGRDDIQAETNSPTRLHKNSKSHGLYFKLSSAVYNSADYYIK
jgi:hypothetical protein